MPKNLIVYDTIIISDVHLGSNLSQPGKLLQLLKRLQFKRLIILGDMFADLNFSRLKREHWAVLSYLRELSNPKREIEIVWVIGNHDLELQPVMSHLVGIEVLDKYEWKVDNKRCIAMHGHQFDPTIKDIQWLSNTISWVFLQIQKIPGFKKSWSRWLDTVTGHFQNLSRSIETKAHKFAALHGYDIICCGHTHEAMASFTTVTAYYNSGCWVKQHGTYIAFNGSNIDVIQDDNVKDK